MENSEELILTMKLNFELYQMLNKVKVLGILIENIKLLRDLALAIAIVINILIMIDY